MDELAIRALRKLRSDGPLSVAVEGMNVLAESELSRYLVRRTLMSGVDTVTHRELLDAPVEQVRRW